MKTIVLFALTLVLSNTASAQLTAGFTANKWNICENDDLLVTDTSTTATGTIISWSWDFGDGSALFVGQQPPYHHYAVGNATYTVTLMVINSANDTAVATHTVTVNPSPKPIVQVTPSPACAYTSVNFSNVGTSVDSVPFYIWNTSTTGAIANGNINYIVTDSDSMCLTVQTIKGCKGSTCTPFTVYPRTEPYFTNAVCANLTMCFNDSSNATNVTKWFWAFGDGDTSTLQNPIHAYSSAGYYSVSLVTESSYGCTEHYSKTINVPPVVGLKSVLNSTAQNVSIINNTLYINSTQPLHYALYSISGQVMAQGNAAPQQGVIHLNTALTNGIYFIQLTQGEQRVTKKIVVQE